MLIILLLVLLMLVERLDLTVKSLEKAADLLLTWFNCNQMKGNGDNCNVTLSLKIVFMEI